MDPNTARHVLRLDPLSPVTAEAVEAAYAREAWERHPSRYTDAAGREAATKWAMTLAEARAALLRSTPATDDASWVPPAASPLGVPDGAGAPGPGAIRAGAAQAPSTGDPERDRSVRGGRRRRVGLVVGIVAASVGVVAMVVGAGFGATKLAERVLDEASTLGEPARPSDADVVRYSSDETYFTFPAALEEYYDGRYSAECPAEFAFGCWETAIIAEASCESLAVDLQYTNDDEDWVVQDRETISVSDVVVGTITPIVFGHDGYDYGWIYDVRCLDDSAAAEMSTNAGAVSTPLPRSGAGRWDFEDTGFWFLASLEFYDDGRLGACPVEFERGCWQAAVNPEASCEHLSIQYSFSNGQRSEETRGTTRMDVAAGEPVDIVFGHDGYDFGWVSHVVCLS